jgi:hypothetical protein
MSFKRIVQILAVAIGISYLACANWKQTVHALTPAAVIACEVACTQAGRPDLAPLCGTAETVTTVLTELAAEKQAAAARCGGADAGAN